jgi:hypothetical protein
MRPRLLHPLGEGLHSRRHRRKRVATAPAATGALVAPVPATAAATATPTEPATADPDVLRVQEAGGPTDHASYSCSCGYLFSADVSTSVICPHCGTGQAW